MASNVFADDFVVHSGEFQDSCKWRKPLCRPIHPSIHLSIISVKPERCQSLIEVFAAQPDINVVSGGGSVSDIYFEAGPKVIQTNLIVVDLDDPNTTTPQFWLSVQLLYPTARKLALVAEPFEAQTLQGAMQAGVYCFARWLDTPEVWCEAARRAVAGRRFYSTAALLGAVQKAIDGFMAVEETRVEYLSPLQERLLDYLIRHENLLVPATDLLREVWQQTVEGDDQNGANQVRCNIKRLRHKLARMPSARYQIITVRGRGYKLARK